MSSSLLNSVIIISAWKPESMPIEIRELVIRTTVTGDDGSAGAGPQHPSPSARSERAAIVAECVEQVMEILREQKER